MDLKSAEEIGLFSEPAPLRVGKGGFTMYRIGCLACLVLLGIWLIGCEGEQGTAGIDKASEAVGKSSGTGAKPSATAEKQAAGEVHGQATKEANSLLDQANSAIKDGKLDQAQEAINKLQGMKGSLPESMQKKIDAAAQSLEKAKAATTDPLSVIPKKAPAKK
jgi:hypothetical protein